MLAKEAALEASNFQEGQEGSISTSMADIYYDTMATSLGHLMLDGNYTDTHPPLQHSNNLTNRQNRPITEYYNYRLDTASSTSTGPS